MEKQKIDVNIFWVFSSLIFFAILQLFQPQLIYQYDVFFMQPWRWWTGHWVHVGWIHYLLNVLALGCLPFLFPTIYKSVLMGVLIVLPPLLSLSFYLIYPDIFAYAGLSGILHGLFIFCTIVNLTEKKERNFAAFILVLLLSKITWEYFFGSLQTAQLIGSPVLTQAHLCGAIYGTILALLCRIFHIKVVHTN